MSLPHLCATTVETAPAKVPYLSVDPTRVERIRPMIRENGRLRIGVVWAGNPAQIDDRRRSMPLSALRDIRPSAAQDVYSLQKGPAAERDRPLAGNMGIIDLGCACEDFADLTAAMSMMDLILSVCTAPAHLAGALGLPVWTMLPRVCDWRWLRRRTDSPWYPTMKLFRQPRHGEWGCVVADVAHKLVGVNSRPR
jgi:hypothetical protein